MAPPPITRTAVAPRLQLDCLVITAANEAQARAYELQLAARVRDGVLPRGCHALVIPDTRNERIGSGAATINALVALRTHFAAIANNSTSSNVFAGKRALILHSGGDSRRLPMYAVSGKLFATLPLASEGLRCGTVFDLLLDDLLSLPARAGGEVLVSAGDAVLGIKRAPITWRGEGVIGVAQRASAQRAMRHGVYVRKGSDRTVRAFLQKPTHDELVKAHALDRDGSALVDTGLLSLDPASIAALLSGAGLQGVDQRSQARSGLRVRRGSVLDCLRRGGFPPLDLYREIMGAFGQTTTRSNYCSSCAPRWSSALGMLFDAMRTTSFSVEVSEVGEFLHIGSMREMLAALRKGNSASRDFSLLNPSHPLAPKRTSGKGTALVLDSAVTALRVASHTAVLDAVALRRCDLGGDNIVVGIHGATEHTDLTLPRGVCLFALPISATRSKRSEQTIFVACGVEDDFKTPLDEGGTFLNQPFAAWAKRAGLHTLVGDRTLWDQPLWCARGARAGIADVAWMWNGSAAPAAWKRTRRYSMRELLAVVDPLAVTAWRERALAQAHRSMGISAIDTLSNPLARARRAAMLATRNAKEVVDPHLRARAFREVGSLVLAQHDMPQQPQRAAILQDQAVWTSLPVRVDLAGGWSDTPPICNEVGGSVVNVAVMLRGQLPIQVVAKLVDEPVIRITSTDLGETRVIRSSSDLVQRHDPTRWSSLAENALVLTGAAPADPKCSLQRWLEAVGGGLSLTMFSAVPKGSGLGTSSILGAATIQCLDRVFGRECSPSALCVATSALEQMLSTRGGWQDQIGGVLGGFKLARTQPGMLQVPAIDRITVKEKLSRELSSRALLYFSGERRMAKNILETVVWKWLRDEPSAVEAVERLRSNAEHMQRALVNGDVDTFIEQLAEYRTRKTQIDPESCPRWLADIGARFRSELSTWCFAGAGGGGFVLLVAKSANHAQRLREKVQRDPPHPRARVFDFEVDPVGLRCAVL